MSDSSSMSSDSENEQLLAKGKAKGKGDPRNQMPDGFGKLMGSDAASAAAADPLAMGSLEDQLRRTSVVPGSRSGRRESTSRRASKLDGVGGGRRESKIVGGSNGRRGTRRGSIHLPGSAGLGKHGKAGKRKKNTKEPWETGQLDKEGYTWDYVMVFKVWEQEKNKKKRPSDYQKEHSWDKIVRRVHMGGLQTFLYKSADLKKIFCQIRCPLGRMR